MTLAQGLLIAALVAVAVIQSATRLGGALATIAWCVAAGVFGFFAFQERDDGLEFLGVQTPQWLYFVCLTAVALYNVWIIVRALRRVRVAAPPPPGEPPL